MVAHRGLDIPGDSILVKAAADRVIIMTGALETGPNPPYQRIAILHAPLGEGRFKRSLCDRELRPPQSWIIARQRETENSPGRTAGPDGPNGLFSRYFSFGI